MALLLLLPEQLPSLSVSSVAGPVLDSSGNVCCSDMPFVRSQGNTMDGSVSWHHNALAVLLITIVSSNFT